MYNTFELGIKYFHYFFRASGKNGHGIHSPFIFQFIREVMRPWTDPASGADIEALRRGMRRSHALVHIEDFGAGSVISRQKVRRVGSIARTAVKSRKYAELLYRMVRYYQPQNILELGTSLGITTAYLARANPNAMVTTLEGSSELAELATRNFENLHLENIQLIRGNFDNTLLSVIESVMQIDFCFIDGNHRQEPTLRYFHLLLFKTHPGSILVFDDIHWSSEMESAWSYIKEHPDVTCTVDLFFVGVVFFRKEFKEKQHFILRY